MLLRQISLVFIGAAFAAAPALAQTNPPANANPPPAAQPAPMQPMNSGNWITQEQPGQWRASKLKGLNIYNQNNEKIGDISELLVDNSGKVQAVVIGDGGFLGVGQRDVAVPFDQIKFVDQPLVTAATSDNRTVGTASPNAPTPGMAPTHPDMATNNAHVNAPATTGSVATPPADTANRSMPDHAVLSMNLTKDQLKAAPEFKFAR